MPEGHTLHALAGRVHHAFAGTTVAASSPQGRFEDGAALLDGRVMLEASAWGKHLFAEFGGDAWLHVHLGLIGKMSVQRHRRRAAPGALPQGVAVQGAVRLRLLNDTYVAMERWMDANGVRPGSAPWESYITDPAEHPDPADWRTEVYWPLAQ